MHGFGFASTLADLDLRGSDLVLPLLACNLGLEAAQLAALVLVAVPLWVLARSAAATTAVAVAVGVVAGSWLVTRVLDVPDPLDPVLAVVLGSRERLALLLAVVALGVLARRRSAAPAVPDGVEDTTVPDPAARVPGA